jgi:hypothetical protein
MENQLEPLIYIQATLEGPQHWVEAEHSQILEIVLDQEFQMSIDKIPWNNKW